MYKQQLKTYLYNTSLETINQHLKSKKITFLLIILKRSINRKLIYLNQNNINQCLDFKKDAGLYFEDGVCCMLDKLIFNIQINTLRHCYCICFHCRGQ